MITADMVKDLRDRTGVPMMDCKRALEETSGDMDKAIEALRKKGAAKAAAKAARVVKEGFIGCYIHSNGKIGVMVEINCETDFVAKNEKFREFAKDIAMHIAASNPQYLKREDVPQEVLEKEKEIHRAQVADKPANIQDKIIGGKLDKYFSEICLLEQPFVKDDKMSIRELVNSKITEIGENLVVKRFIRYDIGLN